MQGLSGYQQEDSQEEGAMQQVSSKRGRAPYLAATNSSYLMYAATSGIWLPLTVYDR